MPVRRRVATSHVAEVDPVSCFRWSSKGDGTDHMLGDPHYPTREAAQRAWNRGARRLVWAATQRGYLPEPAAIFDGLTHSGQACVLWHWNTIQPFPLAEALAALAADREALDAFERTSAGRWVSDYLALFRAHLENVGTAARALAEQHYLERTYPGHTLFTAETYGGSDPHERASR